ncbi:3-phenylpropionate MFS transporter [Vibrio cholerae]|nr:3-phenylpropionate MFS transporter [Vibrio cholerae]
MIRNDHVYPTPTVGFRNISSLFFAYGVYLPFWSLWFEDQGVSATDIGVLVGIGFATRCVANLELTPRLHRVEQLRPALRWLSFAAMLFVGFHFYGRQFWLMALATVLFNLCCGPVVPTSDAMANYYAKLKMLDYGRTRLWGRSRLLPDRLWSDFARQVGQLADFVHGAGGVAVSWLMSLRQIIPMPVTEHEAHAVRPKLKELLTEWPVVKFLLLVALIQGSHAAYYSFGSIYWKQAGHPEDIIGYLWSLGVVAEVLVFAFSNCWFAGWSLRTQFFVASLGSLYVGVNRFHDHHSGLSGDSTAAWGHVCYRAHRGDSVHPACAAK